MSFRIAFLLAASLNTVGFFTAFADQVYHKPYDCTYESTTNGVVTRQHCMCDGKGHMRVETEKNGEISLMLGDATNHTIIVTYKLQGKNIWQKSRNDLPDYTPASEQYKDYTPLGPKVVNGYACHGYQKKFPGGSIQTEWIADDTEAIVLSESHGNGDSVLELKTYSEKAPSFSMEVPPGYIQQHTAGF
jgi:hypothetical protein